MIKKLILPALLSLSGIICAQKVDTTFYDQDWQGVKYKELASYIRYDFNFNDPNYDNKTRIFYMNGTVEREGTPLKIDKYDGTQSTWKKKLSTYYPNGNKKEIIYFDLNGNLEGSYNAYDQEGNPLVEYNYKNGKPEGKAIEYIPDGQGSYFLTIYENGQPLNNESTLIRADGRQITVDFQTKAIKTRNPLPEDCRSFYKDGINTCYYELNGIYLAVQLQLSRNYGKYYQCFIQVYNDNNSVMEINPDNITGLYLKGDKSREIELVSADEYLAKVERSQAMARAATGFSAGMNSYNAGYTTSTTTGSVVGTGGYAVGSATTTTFSAAEKQAVADREAAKMQSQYENDVKQKEAIDGSLLKRTIVEPGEQLYKSFYIAYLSADKLLIKIKMGQYEYPFLIPVN